MIKPGPLGKTMPKGMDEFFSFIRLLNDDDSYQEKATKLAEQIARYEELVGAKNTIDKADTYLVEANRLRMDAEAHKVQTDIEQAKLKERLHAELETLKQETVDQRAQAIQDNAKAKTLLENAEEKMKSVTNELNKRERDVSLREKQVGTREAAVTEGYTQLEDKGRKLKEIFA